MTAKPMKAWNPNSKQTNFHKDKPVCSHYGYIGHTFEKCYKIHDFFPSFNSKKGTTHTDNQSSSSTSKGSEDVQ